MAVTVEIVNRQKILPLQPSRIRRTVKTTLESLGVASARLCVVLVGDGEIRKINRHFLRHDYATDVLSFNHTAESSSLSRSPVLEGEIIISAAMARLQANEFFSTPGQELTLYLIHGILHLTGYDDHGGAATRRMRQKEQELMRQLAEL